MSITRRSDVIRAAYGLGRSNRSSRAEPPTPNRSLIGTATPHLASTACTPCLAVAAQGHQLGAVANQLAQFAGGRRGDPRLGQASHPQQVGQVGGVAEV